MKTTLMIEAEPSELARILASLGASTASVTMQPSTPGVTHAVNGGGNINADDDESGDADAAPGSTDKNGLPWDDRIHSTPAKLTGKGVWRAKRGVSDALVQQVEAELRARPQQSQPVPQPQFQQPAPMFDAGTPPQMQQPVPQPQFQQPTPVQQTPLQQTQIPGAMATHAMPNAQAPQVPTQIAQTQAAPGTIDFQTFMGKVGQVVNSRDANGNPLADANYFNSLAQRVGQAFNVAFTSIADFGANQGYVDYAVQVMMHDGKWVN